MANEITSTQQLSVGQVAQRSGIPVSTLHFYESKGLLKPARSKGNQRVYPRSTLRRIAIIKVAQRMGIPLAEIREALEGMPHDRQATAAEWARVAAKWSETLQKRIDTLVRLKDSLESCIGCGCLTLGECPLRNPEDQLGRGKAGPVLLDLPA